MRPDYNDYFWAIAKVVASRATCPSRSVGAVLVNPATNTIISTGYNGAPIGTDHCGEPCQNRVSGSSFEKCKAVHGEANAIISAARMGLSTNGAWLYLTTTPCVMCSRLIINAGIVKVLATSAYPQPEAIELLVSAGVTVLVEQGVPMPNIRTRKEGEEPQRIEFIGE